MAPSNCVDFSSDWLYALVDAGAKRGQADKATRSYTNIFEFTCTDIDGKATPLSTWQGQVALVVNVACE